MHLKVSVQFFSLAWLRIINAQRTVLACVSGLVSILPAAFQFSLSFSPLLSSSKEVYCCVNRQELICKTAFKNESLWWTAGMKKRMIKRKKKQKYMCPLLSSMQGEFCGERTWLNQTAIMYSAYCRFELANIDYIFKLLWCKEPSPPYEAVLCKMGIFLDITD